MKKIIVGLVILAVLAVVAIMLDARPSGTPPADYKTAEYIIGGERVLLGGTARYFGNEARTDLNGDGQEDVVFLLTDQPGGTGTFYYVVAALASKNGYIGSHALLVGDRIAPQTTEVAPNGLIIVNYADRAPGQSFAERPSVGKSLRLKFNPQSMQFGEVVADFEGEADPGRMTLVMKTWEWVSAQYNDGRVIKPQQPGKFTITFAQNRGQFTATTDCNSMGGTYALASDDNITFTGIYMTKMYCEGSQESEFASLLANTQSYHFTSRGELVLGLKFDSGTVVFR
jgi:heat shock protein HslJ